MCLQRFSIWWDMGIKAPPPPPPNEKLVSIDRFTNIFKFMDVSSLETK